MYDLIRRQDAIDAFLNATSDGDKAEFCVNVVKNIPSAQHRPFCYLDSPCPYQNEEIMVEEQI